MSEINDIQRSVQSRLYHIGRTVRRRIETFGGMEDLTMYQIQALLFIQREQPVKMGALAEELGITPGSATLLADRLVDSGWLTRVHDTEDRRSVSLTLTKPAEEKLVKILSRKREHAGRLLNGLSVDDLRELDRLLKIISKSVTPSEVAQDDDEPDSSL